MSQPIALPSISFVVARSSPAHIIGKDNALPWHLKTDLQRFRKITLGHVVLMGRSTFESIGRPLPSRVNIILSRRPSNDQRDIWSKDGPSLLWSKSSEDAMYLADIVSLSRQSTEFFVIGGEQMYSLFEKLGNRVHLTEVFTPMKRSEGDAYFDKEFDLRKWAKLHEEDIPAGPFDEFPSRYTIYDRRRKWTRYVQLKNYFTTQTDKQTWVQEQLSKLAKSVEQGSPHPVPFQYRMFEDPSN